jgi:small nuclear ribonucleoprotein (snRNP)-like protein
MSWFFFYNKLKNHELIDKISKNNDIYDGSILVENFDPQTNTLITGNNKILDGKLVHFDASLSTILNNIHEIRDDINYGKSKYTVDTILVNYGALKLKKAYIIY